MSKHTQTDPSERALRLSEDLRAALKGIVRSMKRDVERQESGLSLIQTMLLHMIDEHPGIGVAELARMQQVRSPTMSGQVKALETAGFVERSAAPEQDRRRSGLRLSQAGQATLRHLHNQRSDWLAQRVARLSSAQLDTLAGAVDVLNLIGQHDH